jgi:chemotaxis protein MotA
LDRSTIAGIVLGLALIGTAVFMGPTAKAFWNPPSLLIVVGGVLATTLIRFPASVVMGSARVIRQAFVDRLPSPVDLVRQIVRLSALVRQESLLVMEREAVQDRFLRRGVELCVDGIDPATVESLLRTEVATVVERHERGQRILRGMGASSPAFGMIGTLIGLVQMLSGMNDPSKIGQSMAVALLTTFYGAFFAYVLFLPLADKLAERSRQEIINREIVIQGLMGILAGHHPRMVERRLLGLLEPGNTHVVNRNVFRRRPAA